ncbi:MAG: hypothetical protein H6737_00590 [Alphaproteobacteria bacterium]|nr:hypothetical protein [Alphaproteobacteria bacterium]
MKTFTIQYGRLDPIVVMGRANAVRRARALSQRTWRPVELQRHDERVEMTFRRGELLSYAYYARGTR